MSTFCAVDDARLIELIQAAKKRIVYIAPGVHEPVAQALGARFRDMDGLDVTVVLDPDEEVCRIGYGDAKGLEMVNEHAKGQGFYVRSQPGLRVGVLLADEQTLVWSPTPRSVEAPPSAHAAGADLFAEPAPASPNGLLLGNNPGDQLTRAVAAEGSQADLNGAEIGKSAITPDQVNATLEALKKNPPIDVDLARVTRVFSTKLQFAEFKVTGAKLSATQLTVPSSLLNVDAKGELKALIQSRLRAFADFKDEEVAVPAFVNGKPAADADGKPIMERVSEASLQRLRNDFEKRYLYDITGFGRLIAKDEKGEFEARVRCYEAQLLGHSKSLRALIDRQANQIIDDAVDLIMERSRKTGNARLPDPKSLREELMKGLTRAKQDDPKISLVFKDVTYEQTKSEEFRKKVDKALPPHKRKLLGTWSEHFDAAREAPDLLSEGSGR